MTLYLIRHAQADERGPQYSPKYPDDSLRPLIEKGQEQAKALAKALGILDIKFDRLFSSPYTRALETAQPLSERLEVSVEMLTELTSSDYPQLLTKLVDNLDHNVEADVHIALVGHEPYLSELTSYLLAGDIHGVNLKFKKAMLVQLTGALGARTMTLRMMLPASVYKKL